MERKIARDSCSSSRIWANNLEHGCRRCDWAGLDSPAQRVDQEGAGERGEEGEDAGELATIPAQGGGGQHDGDEAGAEGCEFGHLVHCVAEADVDSGFEDRPEEEISQDHADEAEGCEACLLEEGSHTLL